MTYIISGLGSTEKKEDLKLAQAVAAGQVAPATASALKQAQTSWDMRATTLRKQLGAAMNMSPSQVEATIVQTIGARPSIASVPKIVRQAIPTKVGPVGLRPRAPGGFQPGPGTGLPDMPVGVDPGLPGEDEGGKSKTMLYVGGAVALLVVGAIVMRK